MIYQSEKTLSLILPPAKEKIREKVTRNVFQHQIRRNSKRKPDARPSGKRILFSNR